MKRTPKRTRKRLREFEDWLKAEGEEPKTVSTLRLIFEFEDTVEDEERLKQFKGRWLQVKGYDANAALVRWWIAEFEEVEEKDPPDRRHTLH